jgi:transcriptional regulator with XRE-family HTH domain
MTLGKKLCARHNLSQPELAEKIGSEQSYLSKLENDKYVPSNEISIIPLKLLV